MWAPPAEGREPHTPEDHEQRPSRRCTGRAHERSTQGINGAATTESDTCHIKQRKEDTCLNCIGWDRSYQCSESLCHSDGVCRHGYDRERRQIPKPSVWLQGVENVKQKKLHVLSVAEFGILSSNMRQNDSATPLNIDWTFLSMPEFLRLTLLRIKKLSGFETTEKKINVEPLDIQRWDSNDSLLANAQCWDKDYEVSTKRYLASSFNKHSVIKDCNDSQDRTELYVNSFHQSHLGGKSVKSRVTSPISITKAIYNIINGFCQIYSSLKSTDLFLKAVHQLNVRQLDTGSRGEGVRDQMKSGITWRSDDDLLQGQSYMKLNDFSRTNSLSDCLSTQKSDSRVVGIINSMQKVVTEELTTGTTSAKKTSWSTNMLSSQPCFIKTLQILRDQICPFLDLNSIGTLSKASLEAFTILEDPLFWRLIYLQQTNAQLVDQEFPYEKDMDFQTRSKIVENKNSAIDSGSSVCNKNSQDSSGSRQDQFRAAVQIDNHLSGLRDTSDLNEEKKMGGNLHSHNIDLVDREAININSEELVTSDHSKTPARLPPFSDSKLLLFQIMLRLAEEKLQLVEERMALLEEIKKIRPSIIELMHINSTLLQIEKRLLHCKGNIFEELEYLKNNEYPSALSRKIAMQQSINSSKKRNSV